ncbi:MAG: hypothetical protein WAU69_10435 [Solirubrobacteraceae bacterium]
MNETLREQLYGATVRMRSRPEPIATLLMPSWRVPLVPLMIAACRSRRAQREQLVVLNWALRDPLVYEALRATLARETVAVPPSVRYEPALIRATNIAHGLGLLGREGDWLTSTPAADALVKKLADLDVYVSERELLDGLPRALPLSTARSILQGTVS